MEPLPPLPFALANYFPAYEDVPKGREVDQSDRENVAALPERPVFRDLAQVQVEIRAAVKSVKAPAALTTPHPIVARLLKQDAERKPASNSTYFFSTYGGSKFSTPVQQRRLRVLSCILTELARLGCKTSGSTHAGERFSVSVGGFWTYIFLHADVEPAAYSYRNQRGSKRAAPERLRFDIVDHDDRTPAKKSWREDKIPLDQQITEIIQGLLLQVEEDNTLGFRRHRSSGEGQIPYPNRLGPAPAVGAHSPWRNGLVCRLTSPHRLCRRGWFGRLIGMSAVLD